MQFRFKDKEAPRDYTSMLGRILHVSKLLFQSFKYCYLEIGMLSHGLYHTNTIEMCNI